MGLLAGAVIHWVAAGLMVWDLLNPTSFETSMPERGWRLALAVAASLPGIS